MKFSIIIPMYNAELYIGECIESLINQNYNNFEIILIDDGSTDKSATICKKYIEKNQCIRYFYQKNSGVSSARNLGIEKSKGDYILFVDSDDFCNKDYLATLEKRLSKKTIITFGYIKLYKNRKVECIETDETESISIKDFKRKIYDSEYIGGYIANKAFNRDIIITNNIRFNTKIHFCEDILFISEYIAYCEKAIYIKKTLYYYRMRRTSASFDLFNEKNVSLLESKKMLIEKNENEPKILETLKYDFLYNYYRYYNSSIKYKNYKKNIIPNEWKFLKEQKINKIIKLIIIKYFHFIYKTVWNLKTKSPNLFD